MKVLSMSFTIFAQIYWYKLRKKSDEEWEKLWENIGQRFRNTLFELEGLLIKIGHKKQCFHLSLLGLLGIGSGIYASNQWIMQAGIGLALISCAGYLLFNHKLKKWMKYMHDWRV